MLNANPSNPPAPLNVARTVASIGPPHAGGGRRQWDPRFMRQCRGGVGIVPPRWLVILSYPCRRGALSGHRTPRLGPVKRARIGLSARLRRRWNVQSRQNCGRPPDPRISTHADRTGEATIAWRLWHL